MKYLSLCILFALTCILSSAQLFIHAHNDYQKLESLTNTLRNKAFSIEADIYLSGNEGQTCSGFYIPENPKS